MPTESLNCPRCGAALQVTNNAQLVTCAFCRSTIQISYTSKNQLISEKDVQIALPTSEETSHREEISNALTRLLKSKHSFAFVIFSERISKKFVQFTGPLTLELDMPCQTLSKQEIERATSFFQKLGIPGPHIAYSYGDIALTKITGQYFKFNMKFGREVDRATLVTLSIFRQIYQFPIDFEFEIKEDFQEKFLGL